MTTSASAPSRGCDRRTSVVGRHARPGWCEVRPLAPGEVLARDRSRRTRHGTARPRAIGRDPEPGPATASRSSDRSRPSGRRRRATARHRTARRACVAGRGLAVRDQTDREACCSHGVRASRRRRERGQPGPLPVRSSTHARTSRVLRVAEPLRSSVSNNRPRPSRSCRARRRLASVGAGTPRSGARNRATARNPPRRIGAPGTGCHRGRTGRPTAAAGHRAWSTTANSVRGRRSIAQHHEPASYSSSRGSQRSPARDPDRELRVRAPAAKPRFAPPP